MYYNGKENDKNCLLGVVNEVVSLFRKRKNKKLKYKIDIVQTSNSLNLKGVFNREDYFAHELWLFSRELNEGYKIHEIDPTNEFEFNISLKKIIEKIKESPDEIFDWYFKVVTLYSKLSKKRKEASDIKIIDKDGELYAEYFIRFGRFEQTNIEGLAFHYLNDDSIINYITTKGNLSLTKNNEPNSPTRIQIDKLKSSRSILTIEGKLFTRNSLIDHGEVVLRGRETNLELTTDNIEFNHLQKDVERKYGLNRYIYTANINMTTINQGGLLDVDTYDLYLKLDLHDNHEEKYIRIGRPAFRARYFLKDLYAKTTKEATIINPYFTFKMANLSLEIYRYPIETYKYLRKTMAWSWFIQLFNKREDIWLVGERTYNAQDTGYAFFNYMRTNYPDKKVYYVIEKDSPQKEKVEKLGNVLELKSKEHIWNTIISKKVISSHHPDYLYPIRTLSFKRKIKADKVFLQHGVMGTKNMVANYGKNALGFDTDLFMVSSDFEKEMIVNDFGYEPENVFVTGLARFDTLFSNDVQMKRQILIIPTWRDWVILDEDFLESEYFSRYKELILSNELHKLSKSYNFEIIFCLHPNMQKFSKHFENDSVRIINQGEIDVQYLIKESALMITDYSSVGFDFSFLNKPVIYYQFDRSRFIGKRPSHLELDNDLPGEIGFEHDQILGLVMKYADNNFQMEPEYEKRANKFIKNKDQLSSKRIYDIISSSKVKRELSDNPKIAMLLQGIFNKYRTSKYYFPSMKLFFAVGSRIIPVDKKMILFESGLGRQYGDSPRNIYEEILNQDLDYKKVWVYNKQHRFNDPNTKRILRLSPKYYYYLLKAGFWVNNQNFPSYIKKRPGTTYLQTWHGTPLKKMLYDLEKVHGRNDDYIESVGRAVANWDYLISPSHYATQAFTSAFRYNKELLEVGYPRNDIFYKGNKQEIADKMRNKLKFQDSRKVILYAPTFRDDQATKNNKFVFDINMDLQKMKEKLGEEYVILLRMHVVVSNKFKVDESLASFVHNVSGYPDIQELLLITDILITDYSSVMFDFANTGKPMLFYTYDLDNYRNNLRGFYMDFEKEAPGPLVYDTDKIIDSVLNIEKESADYHQKYNEFREKYCSLEDGFASKRVVDKVFRNRR